MTSSSANLKRILPQRPDLKVIITSATIDPERFARHFSPSYVPGKGIVDENLSAEEREIAEAILPDHAPPIIEVSGRTYPVEIRYRPLDEEDYLSDDEIEDATTPPRASSRPSRNSPRKRPATFSSSSPANAKFATPRTLSKQWFSSRRA